MWTKSRRLLELAVVFAVGVFVGAKACSETTGEPAERAAAPEAASRREVRTERSAAELPSPPAEPPAPPQLVPVAAGLPDAGAERVVLSGRHAQPGGEPPPKTSERSHRESTLEIVNDCAETLMIAWIDFDGAERRADFALPGTTWSNRSYEHHVFRLRIADAARTFVRDVAVPETRKARLYACGTGELEIVDAGPRSEPPTVKPCPVPFNGEPSANPAASPGGGERVSLHLRNTCADIPVRMQWIRLDGGLRDAELLDPGLAHAYTSYVGHRFRLFDGNTGRWIRDFEVDGGADIDLCPCPE
jgi:hypothetical protein